MSTTPSGALLSSSQSDATGRLDQMNGTEPHSILQSHHNPPAPTPAIGIATARPEPLPVRFELSYQANMNKKDISTLTTSQQTFLKQRGSLAELVAFEWPKPALPSLTSSEPTMAGKNSPDFETEYEKAKENLKFFEDAITKKKELDKMIESVQHHKRDIEATDARIKETKLAEEKKHQEFATWYFRFQQKAKKYARSIHDKDVLFDTSRYTMDLKAPFNVILAAKEPLSPQKIKDKVELAKANLEILQEEVKLFECREVLESLSKQHRELAGNIIDKREAVATLEKQETGLKLAFEEAVEEWKTKYQGQFTTNSSDILSIKCASEEKDLNTAVLEHSLTWYKFSNAENEKTIASLREKIADMQPIYDVGTDILQRRQEMQKPKGARSLVIIERGNKAAHYGSALADAQRVHSTETLESISQQAWYEKEYGFAALFVLNVGKGIPKFIEILDWHAAMKHFHPSAFAESKKCKEDENAIDFLTLFAHFRRFVTSKYTKPEELDTFVNGIGWGGATRATMKSSYQQAYETHKAKRASQYNY